jgi:hypothetical protein
MYFILKIILPQEKLAGLCTSQKYFLWKFSQTDFLSGILPLVIYSGSSRGLTKKAWRLSF